MFQWNFKNYPRKTLQTGITQGKSWFFNEKSGMISGMISGIISGMIIYQGYLWVLVTETMAIDVKRIASCLGSAIKKFTLPLDTTKRVQVAMVSSNEISSDSALMQSKGCPASGWSSTRRRGLTLSTRPAWWEAIARLGVQCGKRR